MTLLVKLVKLPQWKFLMKLLVILLKLLLQVAKPPRRVLSKLSLSVLFPRVLVVVNVFLVVLQSVLVVKMLLLLIVS